MYRLNGNHVLYEDRSSLTREEMERFLWYALTRKKRGKGRIQEMLKQLELRNRASHTQSFSSWFSRKNSGSLALLKLCIWKREDCYYIACFGNRSEWALERVNEGPSRYAAKLKRRAKKSALHKAKQRRTCKSYRTKDASQKRPKKAFLPAPLATKRKERLVRQFRKHEITWHEAAKLVETAFEVRGNWKYTTRQVVRFQLFSSLEQSGERFAQFRRRGFTVRFDLVDGIWRGDLTSVTIHCTKDNANPVYRRLRNKLKSLALPTGADRKNERRRTHRRLRRQRKLLAVA